MIDNKNINENRISRGEIYYVDLGTVLGSEQGGIRPMVVIQNDTGNHFSPTVIMAAMTSQEKNKLPTHVSLDTAGTGLEKFSTILLEQVRTIDKERLQKRAGKLKPEFIAQVDHALAVSVGLAQ